MTYIICTDLDRTLIANGAHPNDHHALPALHSLLAKITAKLIYVSGRDIELVDQAINQYKLPTPDFAITDVGSQIYHKKNAAWQLNINWQDTLQKSWNTQKAVKIKTEFSRLTGISVQEPDRQSKFKLSFYYANDLNVNELKKTILSIFEQENFKANIVTSVDETTNTGLIDIIPHNACKSLAIQFLIEQELFDVTRLVFSGDSGNDMSVLSSQLNTILVNNAEPKIKTQALNLARQNYLMDKIYIAKGDFVNLNGNYCAGILEGLAYYFPELKSMITELVTKEELNNIRAPSN